MLSKVIYKLVVACSIKSFVREAALAQGIEIKFCHMLDILKQTARFDLLERLEVLVDYIEVIDQRRLFSLSVGKPLFKSGQ